MDQRQFLRGLFDTAVSAADPAKCLAGFLGGLLPELTSSQADGRNSSRRGRVIVVGGGKAAAAMARALEQAWPPELLRELRLSLGGTVVTRYGHRVPTERIDVLEASHPVPDAAGEQGAARLLEQVRGLTADDLVICLMSGGASALLTCPAGDITLEDKQDLNRQLLRSGATITEMNAVRKHVSAIKGGRLAVAAFPARLVTLAISDVPGDAPDVIGSGPTVADETTRDDALSIIDRFGIKPAASIAQWLARPESETPLTNDPVFANSEFRLIATPQMSLEAAATYASAHGVTPVILGDAIEGEAREVAIVHAGIARQVRRHGQPAKTPAVLLSGGETTVTVRGNGRGGRNAEFLLSLAVALEGADGISALAGDTDGIDGTQDNAGAILTPDTWQRAQAAGLDLSARLAQNDGYSVFSALGDLVMTGPTLTNVNDFRAVLIEE